MTTRRPTVPEDPDLPAKIVRYAEAVAAAGDCQHGVPGGWVIRPTTGNPVCAKCRRTGYSRWRTADQVMAAR